MFRFCFTFISSYVSSLFCPDYLTEALPGRACASGHLKRHRAKSDTDSTGQICTAESQQNHNGTELFSWSQQIPAVQDIDITTYYNILQHITTYDMRHSSYETILKLPQIVSSQGHSELKCGQVLRMFAEFAKFAGHETAQEPMESAAGAKECITRNSEQFFYVPVLVNMFAYAMSWIKSHTCTVSHKPLEHTLADASQSPHTSLH